LAWGVLVKNSPGLSPSPKQSKHNIKDAVGEFGNGGVFGIIRQVIPPPTKLKAGFQALASITLTEHSRVVAAADRIAST
jgi:hypothetical protein